MDKQKVHAVQSTWKIVEEIASHASALFYLSYNRLSVIWRNREARAYS
jgi:hypothetical protein